jgi:protein-S-isoprenylcysteine O-methyltransferase Ste14
MQIIGKTTISPFIFYPGKISSYITWILLLLSSLNIISICDPSLFIRIVSYSFASLGLIITCISLINLGKSTRLGLPTNKTVFKTSGLYRFSRNPMYLGFNILTISSMIYHYNIFYIYILGLFSFITYHLIIIKEEQFMEKTFGNNYKKYKKRTSRYL